MALLVLEQSEAQVFIQDEVGLLSGEEIQTLGQALESYEIETSHEIAIRVVDSLDLSAKSIRFYASRLFEELDIGKVGLDNGILIVLAPKNRKVAIELGYGVEPYISDLNAQGIIENDLAPKLKEEKYLEAFQKAIGSIQYYLKDFRVLEAQADSLLIDEVNLLSSKEKIKILNQLKAYEEESGHKTWVRILHDNSVDQVSHKIAKQLFMKLYNPKAENYQTLIYIGVYHYSEGKSMSFNHNIIHNWEGLAQELSEQEDHYYHRYDRDKAMDLIAYRLQLKVLFGCFHIEKYYAGIRSVIKHLKKIHSQKIRSTQIDRPTFFWHDYGFILMVFVPLLAVALLGFFFGGGGSGGSSGSSPNYGSSSFTGTSSTTSYGGSSSSGSSGGGSSYGGGSFGGGSSGGGGADGDY